MAHKVVLVSHVVRDKVKSSLRLADIAATRRIVAQLRRQDRITVYTVPYLLYAEFTDDFVAHRMTLRGWEHTLPDELWLYGPCLCDGMQSEIEQMRRRGLLYICKDPRLERWVYPVYPYTYRQAAE